MFEQLDLKKGITVLAVEFPPDAKGRASLYIRTMMTDNVEKGFAVVSPLMEKRKTDAKDDLALLESLNKKTLLKKVFRKKESANVAAERGRLNNIIANPLFDFGKEEGKNVLQLILDGLKAQGLTMTKETKSNGEMIETTYLFV